ncbi:MULTISPECIES: hypothetical protein [unclassified Sphingopyxis]|uniref:hypothetical protein n=1 Tax=unclassified Sphingopyxis TaxID=2614943 RepID=UPI001E2F6DCC|nr:MULTISPECIES: hypothetical protein [unclassified Sphingopyxis]
MTKLDLDWPHNFNEIPKEVFVRKDVYDTELQRIFHGEEWHPVCHESEIPERGDFKTFRLAGIRRLPMALCFLLPPSLRKASNRCSGSLPSPTASDCRSGPSGLDGTSHMAGRHPANPDILSSI